MNVWGVHARATQLASHPCSCDPCGTFSPWRNAKSTLGQGLAHGATPNPPFGKVPPLGKVPARGATPNPPLGKVSA
eukprot:49315-Alexandrium_andersonii.AAC.1